MQRASKWLGRISTELGCSSDADGGGAGKRAGERESGARDGDAAPVAACGGSAACPSYAPESGLTPFVRSPAPRESVGWAIDLTGTIYDGGT